MKAPSTASASEALAPTPTEEALQSADNVRDLRERMSRGKAFSKATVAHAGGAALPLFAEDALPGESRLVRYDGWEEGEPAKKGERAPYWLSFTVLNPDDGRDMFKASAVCSEVMKEYFGLGVNRKTDKPWPKVRDPKATPPLIITFVGWGSKNKPGQSKPKLMLIEEVLVK